MTVMSSDNTSLDTFMLCCYHRHMQRGTMLKKCVVVQYILSSKHISHHPNTAVHSCHTSASLNALCNGTVWLKALHMTVSSLQIGLARSESMLASLFGCHESTLLKCDISPLCSSPQSTFPDAPSFPRTAGRGLGFWAHTSEHAPQTHRHHFSTCISETLALLLLLLCQMHWCLQLPQWLLTAFYRSKNRPAVT